MLSPLHQTRALGRGLALGTVTLAMLGTQAGHARLWPASEHPDVFQRYLRYWARALLLTFGCETRVAGELPPRTQRGRLIVANHRSPMDVAILLGLFGGSAVARSDLSRWPVLGLAARRAGTIFVDRTNSTSGAVALRAIRRYLRQGRSLLVFPEGGTFCGDTVRPFKAGAFSALAGLDAEILPIGLAYDLGCEFWNESFVAHLGRVAGRRRTHCAVRVGRLQLPARRGPDSALSAHQAVQDLVRKAREDWRRWRCE